MRVMVTLLVSATILCGCMSVDQRFSTRLPVTAQMKQSILIRMKDELKDPYSVRDAEISDGIPGYNGAVMVCVRLNAKNSFGAYTGRRGYLFELKNERVTYSEEGHMYCSFTQVSYGPFPEINALKAL